MKLSQIRTPPKLPSTFLSPPCGRVSSPYIRDPIPVKPRPRPPLSHHHKLKGPRMVYGYYVIPYNYFVQAKQNGVPTIHNSSWATFYKLRVDICKATGFPNGYETFRSITSVGYCIVLADNISEWDRHPPDLEDNLKAIRGLLRTNEKPKWYIDPQKY